MTRSKYAPTPPIDVRWFVEQEQKIQELAASARRLRAQRRKQFCPGQLYVVEFDSGVVKVGRTENVAARMRSHEKTGLVRLSWASKRHMLCNATERQVLAFCNLHGSLYGGHEYFRDVDFADVQTYAELVVADALRRQYLERLIEAADGDLSMTWAEAQARLGGAADPHRCPGRT